jgi:hypothetical protein
MAYYEEPTQRIRELLAGEDALTEMAQRPGGLGTKRQLGSWAPRAQGSWARPGVTSARPPPPKG